MRDSYRGLQLKYLILNCLIKEDKPLIANKIAKKIKKTPQSVSYHLNQMVDCGILIKNGDGTYKPQEYFLNLNMYRLFYDEIERFIIFLRENTDTSQMKENNIIDIFRLFMELFFQYVEASK